MDVNTIPVTSHCTYYVLMKFHLLYHVPILPLLTLPLFSPVIDSVYSQTFCIRAYLER